VSILAELQPIIDLSIDRLAKKKFVVDPIAGERYSRLVSVLSSAYKRHGYILERALLERLKQHPGLIVWNEVKFLVSPGADHFIGTLLKTPDQAIGSNINYGEGGRTLQTDLVVYDIEHKTIKSYEVKRGSGFHDSGKKRSILRDTLCTQVLLQSYGQFFDLDISLARAHVIFYYGMCSIKKPFSLTGDELDDHFSFPVKAEIEAVNAYFEQRLFALLDAV
jgi:hypothetical protein